MSGEHKIEVRPERRIGGAVLHRAVCSCGKYRSGLHGYPGRAEAAGLQHKRDKEQDQVGVGDV